MRKLSVNEIQLSGNAGEHSKAELERRRVSLTVLPTVPAAPVKPKRVPCPAHLGEVGKKKFRQLIRDGIFPNVETAEHFARLYEQKIEADKDIRERGVSIEGERGTKVNPSLKLSSDCAKEMTKLLAQCSAPKGDPASDLIAAAIAKMRKP